MLRSSSGTFPRTHVFPGGIYNSETDPSLSYTALRETYEETGLLIGPPSVTRPVVHAVREYPSYDSAFKHVFNINPRVTLSSSSPSSSSSSSLLEHENNGQSVGQQIMSQLQPSSVPGGTLWLPQNEQRMMGLERISNWTTPLHVSANRFVTQYYVCRVPEAFEFPELPPLSSRPRMSKESGSSGIPEEGHREVELLEWLGPYEALSLFREGKIKMLPSQFYIMTMLSEYGLEGSIERLRNRSFTPSVINKLQDGRVEMDWGQGESGILQFGKKGTVDKIEFVESRA